MNSDLACSDVRILSVILANMHGDAVLLESISGSIVVARILSVILANMHGDAVLLESISGSIVVASLLDGDGSVFFFLVFYWA